MQISTTLRTLALGSMLAFSVLSPLAVHVSAAPNDGGGGGNSDTRPVGSACAPGGRDGWICTTPDGGMWSCWDLNDRTACININPSPQSQAGFRPIVIHPVSGGAFDPGISQQAPAAPRLPQTSLSAAP